MSFPAPDCQDASVLQKPMRIFQKGNLFDGKGKVNRDLSATFLVKLVRLGEQVWILGGLFAWPF